MQPEVFELAQSNRDRMTQAVLPMDTTMVDVTGLELWDVLDNEPAKSLIQALGDGIFVEGFELVGNIGQLRYGKVIIAMDRGAEGTQIRDRVLAFLKLYMAPLVTAGHVYTVASPSLEEVNEVDFIRAVTDRDTRVLSLVV